MGGFTLPEAGSDYTEREHLAFVNYRAVVTPRVVNEFSMRAGHQSLVNTSRLANTPQIVVQDAFTGGGAQSDRHEIENRVQFDNIVSWNVRKHLVKAGVTVPGFSRRGMNDRTNVNGTFSYSSLDDFVANRPYLCELQRGNGYLAFRQKDLGLFVQDDFKPRPNLSLSLGLRYDWQNYLSDHNNFAPRVSAAFSPDRKRKTVLRAGAGAFYERTGNGAIADRLRFDGHHLSRFILTNPRNPDPLSGGATLESQLVSVTRFAPDLRSPPRTHFGVWWPVRRQQPEHFSSRFRRLRVREPSAGVLRSSDCGLAFQVAHVRAGTYAADALLRLQDIVGGVAASKR